MNNFIEWLKEATEGLSFSFGPMKAEEDKRPKLSPEYASKLDNAVLNLSPTIPGVAFGNLRRRQGSQYSGFTYKATLDEVLNNYIDMINDLNDDVKAKTGKQRLLFNYLSTKTPEPYMNNIEKVVSGIGKGYLDAFKRIRKYHNLFIDLKNKYGDRAAQIEVSLSKHRPEDESFAESKKNLK